jgi:hypothetical protein
VGDVLSVVLPTSLALSAGMVMTMMWGYFIKDVQKSGLLYAGFILLIPVSLLTILVFGFFFGPFVIVAFSIDAFVSQKDYWWAGLIIVPFSGVLAWWTWEEAIWPSMKEGIKRNDI